MVNISSGSGTVSFNIMEEVRKQTQKSETKFIGSVAKEGKSLSPLDLGYEVTKFHQQEEEVEQQENDKVSVEVNPEQNKSVIKSTPFSIVDILDPDKFRGRTKEDRLEFADQTKPDRLVYEVQTRLDSCSPECIDKSMDLSTSRTEVHPVASDVYHVDVESMNSGM